MLNHLEFKQKRHELQVNFYSFRQKYNFLYQRYCLRLITERRNIEHAKMNDVSILTLLYKQLSVAHHSAVFIT